MGYEEFSTKILRFNDLSAGWFPGKEQNDIPGSVDEPSRPVGATDADSAIWYEGALRKLFGTAAVTTPTLGASTLVNSLYYSTVLGELVGNVGTKIYTDLDDATPDDRTAALTIANVQMSWTQWQWETTKYVIGVDGANSAVKWTGSGDAAVLAGSPPTGRWVTRWQDAVWLARSASEASTVFFSNTGDPETWSTDDDYKFDAPITGMAPLGDKLFVFMEDHIGCLSGTNNRLLTKIDRYISGYGATGGHTIRAAKLRGQDVLIFHSKQGFCAIDGARNVMPLSSPIRRKYTNSASASRWNAGRFTNAYATYFPKYGWYVCALSDGADTSNDFAVILDLNRIYEDSEGIYVPHWPVDGITMNALECVPVSGVDTLYFGGTTGIVSKFDESLYTRGGAAYSGYYTSKTFDNVQTWLNLETNIVGDQQSVSIDVYVNADLSQGDGTLDTISMDEDAIGLDTFILGTDRLAGLEFIYKNADINNDGRFFKFKVKNARSGQGMEVQGVHLLLNEIGVDENVDEVEA